MAVDIKLNQIINAFDAQLDSVLLEDAELSVRSFAALTRCGCVTIGDAKRALKDGSFLKQKGVGPRAVKEVEEIIRNIGAVMPTPTETEVALYAARREIERLIAAGDADSGLIHFQGEEIARLTKELETMAHELARMTRLRDHYRNEYYRARK